MITELTVECVGGCSLKEECMKVIDWIFRIKIGRKKPHDPVPGIKYPRIIKELGPNPEQYPNT